jgi:hypothetical protein
MAAAGSARSGRTARSTRSVSARSAGATPAPGPVVRVGSRFLPVAACDLPSVDRGGVVVLPIAPGTPVHAVASGRVVAAEGTAVGEVVLRIDDEIRLAYRRLQPSSVTARQGEPVEAGDLLGVVARTADGGTAALELAASRADGTPVDVVDLVVGAADPMELFLVPPRMPGLVPSARRPAQAPPPATDDRPPAARLARGRRAGRASPAVSVPPAQPTPVDRGEPAAPATRGDEPGESAARTRGEPAVPAAREDDLVEPAAVPTPTEHEPAEGTAPPASAAPASRLASRRRRPRRPS